MVDVKTLYAASREEWHTWLSEHCGAESEIWLVFYKKHTGRPCVSYEDAVQEALCFGWIDSLMQSVDAEYYIQKFTPRKPSSKWSETNKQRIRKLIAEGRMTEAGLAKITFPLTEEEPPLPASQPTTEVPEEISDGLRASSTAWENFNTLAPSYRGNYIKWIMAAKREETRRKRIEEAIGLLERGEKLGLK